MHPINDASSPAGCLPRTVALIPDGNARWAAARGLTTEQGHMTAAAVAIMRARDACELGIEQLSLYSFSTENWSRSAIEVDSLMGVFARHFGRAAEALEPCGIRIRMLGLRTGLPKDVLEAVDYAEAATAHNSKMTLFVALNYGGRQELLDAAQRYTGGGEQAFRRLLYAPEMQDPDLIIRTGGERRLSNGFVWHSSFSELHFVDELWPDFTREHFEAALADFGTRVRTRGAQHAADMAG
ncbi:polyprenyl diphosphate synthase [Mycobacterium vicinigordonae]|uniref:Isoprenyl transferase n=1 Tax=Mycobacterium vicinigordonae TaxID=1719132 RepID=A0A7D6DYW1_9MYCO|nr:polyprenyl diphosphate synthase [Mycobacterium vicinigordonae]QLL08127.1 di-trans,poly-cis-decaprenylcistransferase [Mycobacterium vicinigordonae]